ncbi:MAG TPA: CsgG/HfaB family protein [Gemmatimonadales bacterium]|nr:CsgG/HfaB family protein [Gemmatimonadales bacterium]
MIRVHGVREPGGAALVALALLVLGGTGLGAQERGQDTRPGIAVLPFENGGSYGQDREIFKALQCGIASMVISELSANPAVRVVEREEVLRVLEPQSVGPTGHVAPPTAATLGKLVSARYVVLGQFVDFYGDVRLDARLVNTETGEIMKVERDQASRDHLFQLIQDVAGRLMKDANLPPVPKQVAEQRMNRHIPTDALIAYSRALLYHDRGDHAKAREMYTQALQAFPPYAEASEGLKREPSS